MSIEKCNRIIKLAMIILMIIIGFTVVANATTKSEQATKKFLGKHTDYGASVWGVEFYISVDYDKSTNSYTAKKVRTSASMYPRHTYGDGDVILAGLKETVDSGSTVNRSIAPNKSTFWKKDDLIVATGTKLYYAYYGTLTKTFKKSFVEKGEFTFSVPDTYIAVPNATLTLTVAGPK